MPNIFTELDAGAAALLERMSWIDGTARGNLQYLGQVVSSATTLRNNLQEKEASLEETENNLERRRLELERSEKRVSAVLEQLTELQIQARVDKTEYATNVASLVADQKAKNEADKQRGSDLAEQVKNLKISVDSSSKSLTKVGDFMNEELIRLQERLDEARRETQEKAFAAGKMMDRFNEANIECVTLRNDIKEAYVENGRLGRELVDARSKIASLRLQEAEMSKEIDYIRKSNSLHELRESDMSTEIADLRNSNYSLELRASSMGEEIAELISRNSSLELREAEMSTVIANLRNSNSSLELRVSSIGKEISDVRGSNSSLVMNNQDFFVGRKTS